MCIRKMTESHLARWIVEHLEQQGWDCYPEAQMAYGRGRADIACVKGDELWIIEVKMQMSLRLLEQASSWTSLKSVNRVSVAFPTRNITPFMMEICKWKEMGIFTIPKRRIYHNNEVRQNLQPGALPFTTKRLDKMIDSLHPDMKNYAPGKKHGYSTPYNRTMKAVQLYVQQNPDSLLKDIVNNVEHHYASNSSARSGILSGALRAGKEPVRAKKVDEKWLIYSV